MTAVQLVNNLQFYVSLLRDIKSLEEHDREGKPHLIPSVTLSYTFITLSLTSPRTDSDADFYKLLCTFRIENSVVVCKEIYSAIKDDEKKVWGFIGSRVPVTGNIWNTGDRENIASHSEDKYLIIADEIAKKGYQCNTGDDYSPGYYSEIIIDDQAITLKQVNLKNARSTDHKDNYQMRTLEMVIPLVETSDKAEPDFKIDNMRIHFSDRSSPVNKGCGDAIHEEILEQVRVYK